MIPAVFAIHRFGRAPPVFKGSRQAFDSVGAGSDGAERGDSAGWAACGRAGVLSSSTTDTD
jgi:hypothetical protein